MQPSKEQVDKVAKVLGTRELGPGKSLNLRMKTAGINRKSRRAYLAAERKHKRA